MDFWTFYVFCGVVKIKIKQIYLITNLTNSGPDGQAGRKLFALL
jgi:hypothetical protein